MAPRAPPPHKIIRSSKKHKLALFVSFQKNTKIPPNKEKSLRGSFVFYYGINWEIL
jgi:hypothetical protein